MISYNPKSWISLIFRSYSHNVMAKLRPVLIFLLIYTTICCYVILGLLKLHEQNFESTIAVHSLLGIVLGLFLVFRTNSAYDRWWEGRKQWGSLVNNCRSLALKMNAFLPTSDDENRLFFEHMISNFAVALKDHLRNQINVNHFQGFSPVMISEFKLKSHIPNHILKLSYLRLNELYKSKIISGDQLFLADKELKAFSDILGGCERIKNTPIPHSYSMYIKKFIFLFIITLPFGFVTTTGYLTIPIVLIISTVMFTVELIAEEIEDPFGNDTNDLPTDSLAKKIKENVNEIFWHN